MDFGPKNSLKRRRNVIAALVIGLLLIGGAGIWSTTRNADPGASDKTGGKGRPGGARSQPVSVAEVREGSMPIWLQAIGTIVPRNLVTVRSRVDGQLLRMVFKEGQMVKQGDLLAEIDPSAFQVQLTQANGQLARDQALLQNAQLDLQRYRDLWAKDSIARQQLDTQEALVRQYQGVVEVDKGQVESAKLQLGYTRISAPISGRIGLRAVDPGNQIHASDANGLATIAQLQPITAVFSVPESQLASVAQGLRGGEAIAVEAWDREQKKKLAVGRLLTIDNQIDPTTGTIKIKAEFANQDGSLFPNQFVNIRMLLGTLEQALMVPVAAVQRGARGSFVYVVAADTTINMVNVTPGNSDGKNIAVTGELKAGDRVVTDGTDKLRPGLKVEVIAPEKRAAATSAAGASKPAAAPSMPVEAPRVEIVPDTPRTKAPSEPGKKPATAETASSAAASASQPWGEGEKPRWWDRVPPEVAEKLMKMSPEERRAWLIKRREEREQQAGGQQ